MFLLNSTDSVSVSTHSVRLFVRRVGSRSRWHFILVTVKAPGDREKMVWSDTVFVRCVFFFLCAVSGSAAFVSAPGSAKRELFRSGRRIRVRQINRL